MAERTVRLIGVWRSLLLAPLLLAVVACGAEADGEEYSEENRAAFITACTDSEGDNRLVRDVCECSYERIRRSLPYEELVALEESLRLDALAPLPDELNEIIADCFVAEADL